MKIILLGYMGSGKTSVGKQLAALLNYPNLDLDVLIEESEGKSISELFRDKGEIYFRRIESETLKSVLTEKDSFVLATGGGTPCYGDTMDQMLDMENVITIYLKSSLDNLTARLYGKRHSRPLIAHLETEHDLKDFIRKHLFERGYYYNRAHVTIDTDGLKVNEIVKKIVAGLF